MNQQPMQPQPQKGGALKIVLIVLGVLFVLGGVTCGGCYFYAKSKITELGEALGDGGMVLASPAAVTDALKGDKKDYVGSWTSKAGSTCQIDEMGNFTIEKKEGGATEKMNAPIAAFQGDDIQLKVLVTMNYKVSKAPHKTADGYEMVVDGITFDRK